MLLDGRRSIVSEPVLWKHLISASLTHKIALEPAVSFAQCSISNQCLEISLVSYSLGTDLSSRLNPLIDGGIDNWFWRL